MRARTESAVERSATNEAPCRPFLKWAGGKSQLLPELLARLPSAFGAYHEPFLGGGALFFATRPQTAWLSDINDELINVYRVVQESVDQLVNALNQHVYDRDYFYTLRDADRLSSFADWTPVARAARFIYLNKTCFNGLYRVNANGQFNTPFGRYQNPRILDEPVLRACHRALQGVSLRCAPFSSVSEQAKPGDFVYLDPPYVPVSASANFTSYSRFRFGAEEQEQLRDLCRDLDRRGVLFLLSNSAVDRVTTLYREFRLEHVDASRAINSKGGRRGKVQEALVSNY
ncbi:MAG: DNA adenine methylase [Bdellovibrionales bacterium]|nr:DNA adenine methylase [Bdellovibrionales bacterium]